jgi:hypothetical protein
MAQLGLELGLEFGEEIVDREGGDDYSLEKEATIMVSFSLE